MLNYISKKRDKRESEKVQKQLSKLFNARTIFEAGSYRNKLIIILLRDEDMAKKYAIQYEQESGVLTWTARIKEDSVHQKEMRNVFRSYATQVLCPRTKVIFLIDENAIVGRESLIKLSNGASGSLLWLRDMPGNEAIEVLERLSAQLPAKVDPSVSPTLSTSSVYTMAAEQADTSFGNLLQYTKFQRNVTVAFASLINSLNTFIKFQDIRYDAMENTVQIIGYNPDYVDAGLRHNAQIRFVDLSPTFQENLILPAIAKGNKQPSDSAKFTQPDSRRKLAQIDSTMLSLAKNVIYIGSYPATHLTGYRLDSWKIVFIDPKIDEDNRKALSVISRNTYFENDYFVFSLEYLETLVVKYQLYGDIVIIDDSYSDEEMTYQHFQESKLNFFETLCASKTNGYSLVAAAVKLNYKTDREINYVRALLPQPYGGDLDELRLIMTPNGTAYSYKFNQVIQPYLRQFHSLEQKERMQYVRFYHALLTTYGDALTHQFKPRAPIIGLYSLTNSVNDPSELRRFLVRHNTSRNPVILNAPYAGRVAYMIENSYKPGVDLSIKDGVITFKSPSQKTWSDTCYTSSDMLDLGYMQITYEMICGHMGATYNGPGFMANSPYADMFNLYMPEYA